MDDAVRRGEPRPRVHADVIVTLNGRPPAREIDPSIDPAGQDVGAIVWLRPDRGASA